MENEDERLHRDRSRSPNNRPSIRILHGAHRGSTIYQDNMGYRYHSQNVTINKRQLRCIHYTSMNCQGRASMNLDNTNFRVTRQHTCPLQEIENPNDNRAQLIQRFPRAATSVTYLQASRSMQRARRSHQPPMPLNLRDWGTMLRSPEWHHRFLNTRGDNNTTQFYQGELNYNGSFYGQIFCNLSFLQILRHHLVTVEIMAADSTFQSVPYNPAIGISQLFTVHVINNDMCFPIFYAYLSRHTQHAYEAVFNFVRQLDLAFSPNNTVQIITDFEIALRNAINRVFPEWRQIGCNFHFNQAILRHARNIGLTAVLRDNETARNIARLLLALAHLPPQQNDIRGFSIDEGLLMVRAIAVQQNIFEPLQQLFNYFEQYWMRTIRPEGFAVYGLNHRTNNFIESFHARLLGYIGVHPPLWTFYDLLRGVEQVTRLEMTQVLNGQQVRRRFATSRHRNNNLLQNALEDVRNGGDPVQYLRRVAHINESYINQILGPMRQPEDNRERIGPNNQVDWHAFMEEFEDFNEDIEPPSPPPVANQENEEENVDICPVCMNEETVVILQPCTHKYCNTCALRLLTGNFNCPLCRATIEEFSGIQFL